MTGRVLVAAFIALVGIAPVTISAQEPEELKVEAQEPRIGGDDEGFIDKLRRIADEWEIVARLNGDIDGWYPRLGGMTTGSGFAFGPGYRTHLFDNRTFIDVSAAATHKGYKAVDLKAEWLQSRYDRVELWTNFRYQDFPQEDYFGLGGSTLLSSRTNYALESTDITALGIYHIRPWVRVGTEIGYFSPTIGRGTDKEFPSTELLFTDVGAPGLAAQPDFLHTTLFTEIDYRDQRGNPRSGGYYKVAYGIWDDHGLEQFDFRRFDVETAQFVPIVTKKHVLASRIGFAFVNNALGERVPFYFVPYVGGSHTLRSVKEFRFQDENAFFWNSEYRWTAIKHLDIAVFYDAGNVHRDWDALFGDDIKTAYGVGFRVNTSKRVFLRLDIGTGGSEGRQVFFKLNESF